MVKFTKKRGCRTERNVLSTSLWIFADGYRAGEVFLWSMELIIFSGAEYSKEAMPLESFLSEPCFCYAAVFTKSLLHPIGAARRALGLVDAELVKCLWGSVCLVLQPGVPCASAELLLLLLGGSRSPTELTQLPRVPAPTKQPSPVCSKIKICPFPVQPCSYKGHCYNYLSSICKAIRLVSSKH